MCSAEPVVFTPCSGVSMKKLLVLAAVLAFSVVAVGCGSSSAGTTKITVETKKS